mmetsp:Transcript_49053/g.106842  ORF Transcript_49053/g.106842 Transcript_49053/m.106842 type:complete len:548 (+) Transcript_49053:27-1670(+)
MDGFAARPVRSWVRGPRALDIRAEAEAQLEEGFRVTPSTKGRSPTVKLAPLGFATPTEAARLARTTAGPRSAERMDRQRFNLTSPNCLATPNSAAKCKDGLPPMPPPPFSRGLDGKEFVCYSARESSKLTGRAHLGNESRSGGSVSPVRSPRKATSSKRISDPNSRMEMGASKVTTPPREQRVDDGGQRAVVAHRPPPKQPPSGSEGMKMGGATTTPRRRRPPPALDELMQTEHNAPVAERAVSPAPPTSKEVIAGFMSSLHPPGGSDQGFQWKRGKILGTGGHGRVFEAFCLSGTAAHRGGFMAVKQIFLQGPERRFAKELEALQREIRLLQAVEHPNIVRYLGATYESGEMNIFLEYLAGGSVASLLKAFGPLSEDITRKYMRQTMRGLVYLHNEKGIIHRDVKGANILVDHDGTAKLADFGCSQMIERVMSASGAQLSIQGSVFWMAPEVSSGTYGRRADVWSVGCTVIEMMAGRHPWPEFPSLIVAIRHILLSEDGPPLPEAMVGDCENFARSCCTRDLSKRPLSSDLMEHPFLQEEAPRRAA